MRLNITVGIKYLVLFLLLNTSLSLAQELPGVGFDRTRVIYNESAGERGVALKYNNNSQATYLLQSWVSAPDGMMLSPDALAQVKDESIPFFVVPPLVRLDAHQSQGLRILRKQGTLPEDRESVFLLVAKAIPNTPLTDQKGGVLRLAVSTSIKLFYRPASLPAAGIKSVTNQLKFTRKGDSLVVTNASPFYLTFSALEVGGKAVTGHDRYFMVPPRGETSYALPAGAGGKVRWSVLDERGEPTPWAQSPLL